MTEPAPPFQALSSRLAGEPATAAPRWELTVSLEQALHGWLGRAGVLTPDLTREIALRLDIPARRQRNIIGGDMFARTTFEAGLLATEGEELLDVVDAVLQLNPLIDERDEDGEAEETAELVAYLDAVLVHAGSAYRVASDQRSLMTRLDPTVTDAVEHTTTTVETAAAEFLRDAWRHIYGRHPDPDAGYGDAVRAVERLACPLVLPNNPKATLGTVLAHLRDAADSWQFVLLAADDDGSIEPVVAMMKRLWTGQVSRHAGGARSRDQTQAEAEAAVHLAATLVHLLSTGALTRRDGS